MLNRSQKTQAIRAIGLLLVAAALSLLVFGVCGAPALAAEACWLRPGEHRAARAARSLPPVTEPSERASRPSVPASEPPGAVTQQPAPVTADSARAPAESAPTTAVPAPAPATLATAPAESAPTTADPASTSARIQADLTPVTPAPAPAAPTPAPADRAPPPSSVRDPHKGLRHEASRFNLETLEQEGAVIGSIRIQTVDIFDPSIPGENRRLFRLVNHLHIKTRQSVIRHRLLFAVGEPFVRSRLEETERNLRTLDFIQDASVEVLDVEGGRVDILVTAQDTWTTRLGARLGSAGGRTTSGINLQESNLLGRGKTLNLEYKTTLDRTTRRLGYEDPNLFGSRHHLLLAHQESTDGKGDTVSFDRPFYSIEDRYAYEIDAKRNTDEFSLYRQGDVIQKFEHDLRDAEGSFSWARALGKEYAERWKVGFSFQDDAYRPVDQLSRDVSPQDIPSTRTTSGPFVAWSRTHNSYIKVRYFERFSRFEDFNLGRSLSVQVMVSGKRLGATANEVLYSLSASKGLRTWKDGVLFGNVQVKGRAGSAAEQGQGHFDVIHYYTGWKRQTFVLKLQADHGVHLDASSRYLLGGDTGLRGYKVRRFDGDNRFLLNVEDRFHFEREFLHLLRLGTAFFVDVGNAWGGDRIVDQKCTRTRFLPGAAATGSPGIDRIDCRTTFADNSFGNLKANVGVALLGDVVRAGGAGFVRLNVAYPINGAKYDQGTILVSFGHSGNL